MNRPFYKIKLVSAVGIRFMDQNGINKIAHKLSQYTNGRYGYQEDFDVDLVCRGDDFDYMKTLSESTNKYDDIKVIIFIRCGGVYSEKWRGIIQASSIKYNYDTCTCTVTIIPNTHYNNYDDVKGGDYNAYQLTNLRNTARVGTTYSATPVLTLQNGVPLFNLMSELLRTSLSASLRSDFFQWNSSNPGYTVGESAKLRDLTLFHRSDIVRATLSGYVSATIMSVNLGDMVDDLCTLFNLRYFIDDGNTFVIEHVSWFDSGPSKDLILPKYSKYTVGTNRVSFDKDEIFKKEKFILPDPTGRFRDSQAVIEYDNSFVRNSPDTVSEEKTYQVKLLSTVLTGLFQLAQDDINNANGITMLAVDTSTGEVDNFGGLGGDNNILWWTKLINDYYLHDRIFEKGLVNGVETTFLSTRRIKLQQTFKIPICCDETIDPFTRFATIVGEGTIKNMSVDYEAGLVELSLLYQYIGTNVLGAPVAVDDFYATDINTAFDTAVAGKPTLIANDTGVTAADPEMKATALGGTIAIRSDGNFLYTPPVSIYGGDSFEYTGLSSSGRADIGAVRVVIKSGSVYLHVVDRPTVDTLYPTGSIVYGYFITAYFYEDPLLLVPLDVTGYGITVAFSVTHNGVTTSHSTAVSGFDASLVNSALNTTAQTYSVTVTPNPDFTII